MEMENRMSEEYSQKLMSFAGDEEAFMEMARRYKAASVREYHEEKRRTKKKKYSRPDHYYENLIW